MQSNAILLLLNAVIIVIIFKWMGESINKNMCFSEKIMHCLDSREDLLE